MRNYLTPHEQFLYRRVLVNALYLLVQNAEEKGRGWTHWSDGKAIINVGVPL